MKGIIIIIFLTISFTVASQVKQVDSLSFCNIKFKMPADCQYKSENFVQCENYSIHWAYMNEQMFKEGIPEKFITQLESTLKDYKKESVKLYLVDHEVQGYQISFESGIVIIAYGYVNDQPVLVQLSLLTRPKTNRDIPEFARQIIKLTI